VSSSSPNSGLVSLAEVGEPLKWNPTPQTIALFGKTEVERKSHVMNGSLASLGPHLFPLPEACKVTIKRMSVSNVKDSRWEAVVSHVLLLKKLLGPLLFVINRRSSEIARVALRYQTYEDGNRLGEDHPDRELLALIYMASMIFDNISRLEKDRTAAQFKSITKVDPPKEENLGDGKKREREQIDLKAALQNKREENKLKRQFDNTPSRPAKRFRYNPSGSHQRPFRPDSGSQGGSRQSYVDSYRPSYNSNSYHSRDQDSRPSQHSNASYGRGRNSHNRRGGHR
jgi:hypothetical protein